MSYKPIKVNIIAMLNEPGIKQNREYVSTLCILHRLVEEEEAYRKKITMLMGDGWEERKDC